MRPLLAILASVFMLTTAAVGNDGFVDQFCNPIRDCTPNRDCTAPSFQPVTRNCYVCLLKNPLTGSCIQRGNDPACEAAKASQNAAMEAAGVAQKAQCEASKASEKLSCEIAKSKAVAECKALKGEPGENNYQKLLLLPTPQTPLPAPVVSVLTTHDTYQEQFLKSLTVSVLENSDLVPQPFSNAPAFTVGSRIFLLPGTDEGKISLRDWIMAIEYARLFSEYGFAGMTQALTNDAAAIIGLADAKATRLCADLAC
ncbi:hypothetical protein DTW90_14515 [Neorhizobium sp. P12A]|nr:hypothetical protein DTW90_14515 [Neorhizobium sp. P12A]